MNCDKEILKVLIEAGEKGLSIQKISMHLFNSCNSLFYPVGLDEMHAYVVRFLARNTKPSNPVVVKKQKRGVYAFNFDLKENKQLLLQFKDKKEEKIEENSIDLSLQLDFK